MPPFPFSAIVGQETLKRALVLCVIQPAIGGVLIRGTKGVAKSTAVRGLAGLLPPINVLADCPFNRKPGEEIPAWPLPPQTPVVSRRVPLVELPLGATEDRVLGSIHIERALQSGRREFEPGLLAAAHRGILYVDEINLLPNHLVDVLLDASASGVHHLEREGISLQHPACFVLVGTMNPEEGDLRPQLLDRFGLVVDVTDLDDAEQRAEAVRRRLAHDRDPEGFAAEWSAVEEAEGERIRKAQELLPAVTVPGELLLSISDRCRTAGSEGLRADLTMSRAAAAWAAHQGRTTVTADDVEIVAEMALVHRRTRKPDPPPDGRPAGEQGSQGARSDGTPRRRTESTASRSSPPAGSQVFDIAPVLQPYRIVIPPALPLSARGCGSIARPQGQNGVRRMAADRLPKERPRLSLPATIRAAASQQLKRGRVANDGPIILHRDDLRWQRPRGSVSPLILFVLDTSGSMASYRRMRQTKAAVLSVLLDIHRRGDQAALLTFAGRSSRLIAPPTSNLTGLRKQLERLPVGGGTPLGLGLQSAANYVEASRRAGPSRPVQIVLLSDGRANVSLMGNDPWRDALHATHRLRGLRVNALVVDTEVGLCRLGRAAILARELGARHVPLEEVLRPRLRSAI